MKTANSLYSTRRRSNKKNVLREERVQKQKSIYFIMLIDNIIIKLLELTILPKKRKNYAKTEKIDRVFLKLNIKNLIELLN